MKLAVLGAGAWGTALAISFARKHDVTLWGRNVEQMAALAADRVNRQYLDECPFPDTLKVTADFDAALADVELVMIVTASAGLRSTLKQVVATMSKPVPVVWACKGFEAQTALLPHKVVEQELPGGVPSAVLSGPSFAKEVGLGLPAAVTIASHDKAFAVDLAARLHSSRLRMYSSDDVVGVEVGGAVKNVMAIAAGIADGMKLGHNARAALITRGLAEVTRLGMKLGGRVETFMGLAGVGDLILTCTGDLSRNRRVGLMMAEGKRLDQILHDLGHVAEGVASAREILRLAHENGVEMPITQAVCRALFDDEPVPLVLDSLLERQSKPEFHH
ncbi:NAD(P)H-dependent glycerol-3-phosphate dehydrogenase [Chitinivorax sp. B]|uniref:NAD(P)H-dependent glycerol-3-phosphate dehydrogenase n=1 Tax=Chitinivorax sp. B TaxID=2502235 RepID=UPI0010F4B125|nr:NAD(P)H-dependent glycerol-3-phosphate dehydrogenase [Chitinivorax sp. B]